MPRADPDRYPGRVPAGPVLVVAGAVHDVVVDGDVDEPVTSPVGADVLSRGAVRWSVAYGANADPDRLIDKRLDRRGALILPARLHGWAPVWEARRAVTGAVPLTLQPAADLTRDVHVLGVHREDTHVLDTSEGRGRRYILGAIGPVAVAARFLLADALAYLPTPTTMLLGRSHAPATYPGVDQAAARAALARRDGPRHAAVDSGVPTVTGWPDTPLADLPLFAYGTLQPGFGRFEAIARHVTTLGAARTPGTIVRTPSGWPAARFGGTAEVHGTLLGAVSPRAATGLFATTDRIEDVPDLFRRVAIQVHRAEDTRWAAAYEWNHQRGAAPGDTVPDGRFTG